MCLYAGTSAGASTASVRIFAPHNIYIYIESVCVFLVVIVRSDHKFVAS